MQWQVFAKIGEAIGASDADSLDPRTVRFTVDDAGSAVPIVTATADQLDGEVVEAERAVPEFDDVFVRIVDRHRAEV